MNTEMLVFIIEIIGTVAFASSGAMVGIRKKMDVLGVIVMAVMTAVGGGIIRDLVLGIHPPNTFKNPIYVEYSVLTAVILFIVFYTKSVRPLISSSTALAMELDTGAWWSYVIEDVARPEVIVRKAVT